MTTSTTATTISPFAQYQLPPAVLRSLAACANRWRIAVASGLLSTKRWRDAGEESGVL